MGYGVSNHCKTLRQRVLLSVLGFLGLIICHNSFAASKSINVYLKLKPQNRATHLIASFNRYLEEEELFARYQIKPFSNQFPLHTTLYLTDYDSKKIASILQLVEAMAKYQPIITLNTLDFKATESGYVMLAIKNTTNLRILDDVTVDTLSYLRNKKAKIPEWAANDPQRREMFRQFGSPNVRDYFNPHFSIFDPNHLSSKQKAELYLALQRLIKRFTAMNSTHVEVYAKELAVGIANSQGQIVKELASFPLH